MSGWPRDCKGHTLAPLLPGEARGRVAALLRSSETLRVTQTPGGSGPSQGRWPPTWFCPGCREPILSDTLIVFGVGLGLLGGWWGLGGGEGAGGGTGTRLGAPRVSSRVAVAHSLGFQINPPRSEQNEGSKTEMQPATGPRAGFFLGGETG